MLRHCWLGIRKSTQPVKIECWGAGVVIFLEWGADCLHMVQFMPLPSQNSLASFKFALVLTFRYRIFHVVLEKRLLKGCSSSGSNLQFCSSYQCPSIVRLNLKVLDLLSWNLGYSFVARDGWIGRNSQWADRKFTLQNCRHSVLNFAAVAAILHKKFLVELIFFKLHNTLTL